MRNEYAATNRDKTTKERTSIVALVPAAANPSHLHVFLIRLTPIQLSDSLLA